jgi:uncharacterized protein YueI
MGYPVIRRSWDQDNFIERKLKQNYEFKFLINSTLNDEIEKKYIQFKKKTHVNQDNMMDLLISTQVNLPNPRPMSSNLITL